MNRLRDQFYRLSAGACGLLLSSCSAANNAQTPCLQNDRELRALTVSQPLPMRIGGLDADASNCTAIADAAKSWTWTTPDAAIVKVSATGVVEGLKPGNFTLSAEKNGKRLTAQGFIMPANWSIKIEPLTATVKVGKFVKFKVVAYDQNQQPLPTVPFSLYAPEFFTPDRSEPALVDKLSYQQVTNPGFFRGVKPGETQIVGELGGKKVEAKLTITK